MIRAQNIAIRAKSIQTARIIRITPMLSVDQCIARIPVVVRLNLHPLLVIATVVDFHRSETLIRSKVGVARGEIDTDGLDLGTAVRIGEDIDAGTVAAGGRGRC